MSPKPIIRPPVLFLAAITAVAVWPLHAAVVLREEFNYPDGPIHETSGGAWTPQPGGAPAIAIENHAALPGGAGTGYVTRKFSAKPAGGRATATLLVRFDGPVQPGKGRQVLFQFTDESGKKRRGRLFMRGGPDGDTVQLGVTSKNASDAVWGARALPLAEEHTLVFHYNSAGGATRLWINPTAATTRPDAEAVDADALAPGRASLQVDSRWNLGRVLISGIVVHDDPPGGGGAAPESSSGAAAPKTSAAPESSSSAAAATAAPSASKPAARSASAAPPPRPKVPAVTPPPARRFYVFLLAGQSNMAGRGPVGEIDRAPDPRILAFDGPGRWIPAAEPLHNDKRGAGVGPGLAFARALLPHLPPDASIGLIPAAFGGTSMAQWQKDYKGDFRWPDGRTLFQLAAESAAAANDGTLAGILWNQGEADGSRARRDGGAGYRAQLDRLIADFRATLGRPALPFVAATLGPWRRPNTTELNQVYLDLPARVPHTAVVDTLAPEFGGKLRNKPNDPAHYDTESARLLGAAYARAMLPLLKPDADATSTDDPRDSDKAQASVAPAAPSASKPAARSASAAPPPRPKVPAVTPPPARRFYVFLLAGQSNMAGRGIVGETDRTPDPRILAFDGPGRWIPAAEPLHNDKRGAGVGPGFAFARALLPHLPPDVSIGLIPAAFGGTSMAQWQKDYKGDFRWPDGRTLFQLATESATAAANEGALAGILWNQGGADIRRTQRDGGAEYRAQLDRLIADFRAALDRPALPFVAATISPWKRPDTKELSQVYLDLPARVPHTAVVDTLAPEFDGKLRNKPNDPAHYDSESARLLGAAYARAMLPLLK